MATFFNKGVGNSATGLGGGTRPAGYEQNMFLDASVTNQIQQAGYNLSPTSFSADYAANSFQKINQPLNTGKSVPAMQDGQGNIYVMDEKSTVYVVTTSPVDPRTGIPTKGNGGAGPSTPSGPNFPDAPVLPGPGTVITPPIYVDPGKPPIPPGGVIGSGKIYSVFNIDDIVPNQQEIVTRALWSQNVGNLLTFFTSSAQTANQKRYYYEIYNGSTQTDDCGIEPQFSIAYGNYYGSGSTDEGGQIEDTPSRAIYSQYKLLCLDPDKQFFTFNGETTEHVYVINVNRARMREFLDEGNIEVNLAHLSGSQYIAAHEMATHTGSAVTLAGNGAVTRLIDDSSINPATIMHSGEVYNMISGTIEDGPYYEDGEPVIYGQLFRRHGFIVLDANKLDTDCSFGTVTTREVNGDNAYKLFKSMSGSALLEDGSEDYMGFQGRGGEKVKSTHYFVRVKNAEYNFSNNPSFVTGSEGDLRHPSMYNDPKTYITTVGLYNTNKELVAVAKMSQAIQKAFTKEALLRIKLDF